MKNELARERIQTRIQQMIGQNIEATGLHIQGVLDTPSFCYSIGLLPRFDFEIICFALPHEHAFVIFNSIHESLKDGFRIELNKVYAPEDVEWMNHPVKFVRADHPLLFDKWMGQSRTWWGCEHPVYQLVLADAQGILPGEEGFDHEYMDPRQRILIAKR